jgi:hypothetical protein
MLRLAQTPASRASLAAHIVGRPHPSSNVRQHEVRPGDARARAVDAGRADGDVHAREGVPADEPSPLAHGSGDGDVEAGLVRAGDGAHRAAWRVRVERVARLGPPPVHLRPGGRGHVAALVGAVEAERERRGGGSPQAAPSRSAPARGRRPAGRAVRRASERAPPPHQRRSGRRGRRLPCECPGACARLTATADSERGARSGGEPHTQHCDFARPPTLTPTTPIHAAH